MVKHWSGIEVHVDTFEKERDFDWGSFLGNVMCQQGEKIVMAKAVYNPNAKELIIGPANKLFENYQFQFLTIKTEA